MRFKGVFSKATVASLLLLGAVACGHNPYEVPEGTQLSSYWQPDTLGDGFYMRYVDQGEDYNGRVRCTVIRKRTPEPSKRGILYVHGFNDYFFQKEMADRFVDSCYNFYAVDLRKYGRSYIQGQQLFEVRDISEYFPDINAALGEMEKQGITEIVLMGHSTGGLITSCYMNDKPDRAIKALILNSPFLDWNMSGMMENVAVPIVSGLGKFFPGIAIRQDNDSTYSKSLLKKYDGEWSYDTIWKLIESPNVTSGWVRAINNAQNSLHKHSHINVPILLLHSDATYKEGDPAEKAHAADAVLDVEDISKYGKRLGISVTEDVIPGGLHDLALSKEEVRNQMYDTIFNWLDHTLKPIKEPFVIPSYHAPHQKAKAAKTKK